MKSKRPEHLRVMTANLFGRYVDPEGLDDLLAVVKPDVFAAQELGFGAAEVLARRFPVSRLEPANSFDGIGLALLSDASVEQLEMPKPRTLVAVLESGLAVGSVRLPPPLSPGWVRTRKMQLNVLVAFAEAHQGPICLLGDFNATPMWPAYRRLMRILDDGAQAALIGKPRPTWPSPRPLLRVDHALVRDVRVYSVSQVRIPGSDHFGLVFDLENG